MGIIPKHLGKYQTTSENKSFLVPANLSLCTAKSFHTLGIRKIQNQLDAIKHKFPLQDVLIFM